MKRREEELDEERGILEGSSEQRESSSFQMETVRGASVGSFDVLAMFGQSGVVILVVAFYWVVSLSLVFLNKSVMKASSIPFPIFITEMQLIIALLAIVFLGKLGRQVTALSFLPEFEFDTNIARKVFPLTAIYVTMLVLTNFCLMYVEVSFYQVVRSLVVVFNIILQWLILGQPSSMMVIISSFVIIIGFVVGSIGEAAFSWAGLITGVLSGLIMSYYSIYTKKVLSAVGEDTWKLLMYNTVMASVLLFPFVIFTGEIFGIMNSMDAVFSARPMFELTVSGLFGFLINIAIFLQIKFTSPLTSSISGSAKSALQVYLGVLFFKNEITRMSFFGILTSLLGSFAYSYIRYKETQKK